MEEKHVYDVIPDDMSASEDVTGPEEPRETGDIGELEDLFGRSEDEYDQIERFVLDKNMDGFASCFPEWDLHPPVMARVEMPEKAVKPVHRRGMGAQKRIDMPGEQTGRRRRSR